MNKNVKTNVYAPSIIKLINGANGQVYPKSVLKEKYNMPSHGVQKIIRDFNKTYPKYKINYNNQGYYTSCRIPDEIIGNLPGAGKLDIYISFLISQILKSIVTQEHKCSSKATIAFQTVYQSTVENTLNAFGVPKFYKLFRESDNSKLHLLSVLPTYTFANYEFENKLFFFDNNIYNIDNSELFNIIKEKSFKYSNDILNVLGDEHKTSLNKYTLFFYFMYEFAIYINKNNQELKEYNYINDTIFDYDSIKIPDFCDFKTLKTIIILELNLKPKTNVSIEECFKHRLNNLEYFPLFGVFTPRNNNIILTTYGMYVKLFTLIDDQLYNSYTFYRLVLIHLVDFRKTLTSHDYLNINNSNFLIEDIEKQIIYECPFNKDCIAVSNKVNVVSYALKSDENDTSTKLLLPNLNPQEMILHNNSTAFQNVLIKSTDTFTINFISTANETNNFKVYERLKFNFPNLTLNIYGDLCADLPTQNRLLQVILATTTLVKDNDGNFDYENIISILNKSNKK